MTSSDTDIIPNLIRRGSGIKLISRTSSLNNSKPSSPINDKIIPRTPTGVKTPISSRIITPISVKTVTPISARVITPISTKIATPISARVITPIAESSKQTRVITDKIVKSKDETVTIEIPIEKPQKKSSKSSKSVKYTDVQINFMLEGYKKLDTELWTLLRPGDEVSYFRNVEPRNENFVRGGYVKYCTRSTLCIQNMRDQKKGSYGYLEYIVSLQKIGELWMKERK